jgi:hypothetical protein
MITRSQFNTLMENYLEEYTMLIVLITFVIALLLVLYEYRIRRPDHIVLYESRGIVRERRWKLYPRHFSLCIPATVHSVVRAIEAEAKGRLPVNIRVAITVAPSRQHLAELIRVGGWGDDAVTRATKELEIKLDTIVREFTEKQAVEAFSSEGLSNHLKTRLRDSEKMLGLEMIAGNILSIEPMDSKISEAMRQQEAARILEQTEITEQKARVAAAKARTDADEKIANYEHALALSKYKLQKVEEEQEAEISKLRVEEELALKRKQLELDRDEMNLLTQNPEMLMLTPQMARLAEASQSLKNARTVVSFNPGDGAQLLDMLKSVLQQVIMSMEKKGKK